VTALASQLGTAFAGRLAEHLSGDEWTEMRRRNAALEAGGAFLACASHDFLDANDVMDAAFKWVVGRAMVLGSDVEAGRGTEAQARADLDLCNAAWTWARAAYLTASPDPA